MPIQILVASDWVVYGEIVSWDRHQEVGQALIDGIKRDIFMSYDGDGYFALNDRDSLYYQKAREMLPLIEKEVFAIVARHSDGSKAWTIYNGVGAWEVLYGYIESVDVAVVSWLNGLPSDVYYEVYQRFILSWNMAHRSPVRRS